MSTRNTIKQSKNSSKKARFRQTHKDAKKSNQINVPSKKHSDLITSPCENDLITSLATKCKIQENSQTDDCSNLVFTPSSSDDPAFKSKYFNGDLQSHEGGKHRGHSISEHIRTHEQLLKLAPKLSKPLSTFFPDKLTADKAVLELFIKLNDDVTDFQNNSKIKLNSKNHFDLLNMDPFIAYSVIKQKDADAVVEIREFTGIRVILRKKKDGPMIVC